MITGEVKLLSNDDKKNEPPESSNENATNSNDKPDPNLRSIIELGEEPEGFKLKDGDE